MWQLFLKTIDFLNKNSGAFLVAFSLIVAFSTLFYSLLTRRLVRETIRLREVQTEPNISLFVEPEGRMLKLAIQNIGLGPAYNVRFNPISDFKLYDSLMFSELSYIKHGLTYVAPGQRLLAFSVFGMEGTKRTTGEEPIEIKVSFQNLRKKQYENTFVIDFKEFLDLGALDETSLKNGVRKLAEIGRTLSSINSAIKRLK